MYFNRCGSLQMPSFRTSRICKACAVPHLSSNVLAGAIGARQARQQMGSHQDVGNSVFTGLTRQEVLLR